MNLPALRRGVEGRTRPPAGSRRAGSRLTPGAAWTNRLRSRPFRESAFGQALARARRRPATSTSPAQASASVAGSGTAVTNSPCVMNT